MIKFWKTTFIALNLVLLTPVMTWAETSSSASAPQIHQRGCLKPPPPPTTNRICLAFR
ncbi:hypothetical protein [Kingella negevensis]|uniref:hypothetical protein n=1 Tax=Kingella negevensis TaxID=1522312 RepID=UPI00254306E8|nr:hypothetical protein [Kingella negevensis]MDK4689583.1 hypothetical protein [Kingella negevensis]WII90428.1 hypothetical protein QEO93_08155 [Kingella negevensis]